MKAKSNESHGTLQGFEKKIHNVLILVVALIPFLSLPGFFAIGNSDQFPSACQASEESAVFWQSQWDQSGPEIHQIVKGGALHGFLPTGVSQNFLGWQDSVLKSEQKKENSENFWRFTVERMTTAGPQMTVHIPKMTSGEYYRISVTARNRSDGHLNIYLRENPAPYRSIGPSVSLESSPQWQTESIVVHFIEPDSGQYSLYFNMGGCGIFDIKEIKITRADADSFNAQQNGFGLKNSASVRRPDPHWNNYIFSSCFPFGVPTGWNCRRGMVSLSDDTNGPSGQRVLKLENGFGEFEQPVLYSAPFQVPDPEQVYAVSFSAKGSGSIQCNGKSFELSDQWQRFETSLQIPKSHAGAVLNFSGNKTFYLDAVRVSKKVSDPKATDQKSKSSHVTNYRRAGRCEIALGLPDSDASESRIQFSDEPSKIRFRLMGDYRDLSLMVKVTNIWGTTKELTPISPRQSEGDFDYFVFPETPFGQFRIEVLALQGDQQIAPVAEFVVTRLQRPIYWGKDAPDSMFGIHVEPISRMLVGLKAGGVNWVRLHDAGAQYSLWSSLEPKKGEWHFYDREIENYRKHHLMIYGQLGGAPVWASYYGKGGPITPSPYWIRYCAPTDDHMADFENYAFQMVKHYKGIIDDWCLWNEPWGSFLHKAYDPKKNQYRCFENQGAEYTKILKAAYTGAKRANPQVRISGFGTTSGAVDFTEQIVASGGYPFCDELDYHQYAPRVFGFPNDGMNDDFKRTFAPVTARYGSVSRSIIMSEGSPINTGSDGGRPIQGIYKNVLPWENHENVHDKADRVVRFLTAYKSCQIKRVFLYTAHGHTNLTKSSFLILVCADGYPHPMLAALSAFAQNAENSKFIEYQKIAPDLYAALFEKKDGTGFVEITGKRSTDFLIDSADPAVQATDLYGNPLSFPLKYQGYVLYMKGNVSSKKIADSLKVRKID